MTSQTTDQTMLDREFLHIRCRLIDIAASLDRIDRNDGAGTTAPDPRMKQIKEAVYILREEKHDRARRVQMVFSDPYDPDR